MAGYRKTYSIKTLAKENQSFDNQYIVTDTEVETANTLIKQIIETRDSSKPVVGDIIEITTKRGDYYKNGQICRTDTTMKEGCPIEVCEKPYIPFTHFNPLTEQIQLSTSGGAFSFITNKLKLIGQREKTFCAWGRNGGCANGSVYFNVFVNVWEYVEEGSLYGGLTTKDYDKFYVYKIEKTAPSDRYEYKVSGFGTFGTEMAFCTKKEYLAWLKTFHGIEFDGHFSNQKIVFTHKQVEKCVPISCYVELKGYKDTTLENGCIQQCKRIQDYKNKTIITYIPFQNEKIRSDERYAYINAYNTI